MIVITGASGFIGSCLVSSLNKKGINNLLLTDKFDKSVKQKNLFDKAYKICIDRDDFISSISQYSKDIDIVFHLGARTDTGETNRELFNKLNLNFSKDLWKFCSLNKIPLIYASSAATYGNGISGFLDDHEMINQLKPLNEYAISKHSFDQWVLEQKFCPPQWYGLKFFNVYGPNEYHKDRMASVVYHAYHQLRESGRITLFKSHHADYKDGEQKRDFIYIKDLLEVLRHFSECNIESGIYNLGSGNARTFNDLANAVFSSVNLQSEIDYTETPSKYRANYQYFTEANMQKLVTAGVNIQFTSLEDGIRDYIQNYLTKGRYL